MVLIVLFSLLIVLCASYVCYYVLMVFLRLIMFLMLCCLIRLSLSYGVFICLSLIRLMIMCIICGLFIVLFPFVFYVCCLL